MTEADRAVNAYLVKQISQLYPEDGTLAEESKDDLSRLEKRRVWIMDPLDGTAEFIAHNGEFVIMIGLAVDGEPVVGVVYQPINDVLFAASRARAPLSRSSANAPAARLRGDRPSLPPRRQPLAPPAPGGHDHQATWAFSGNAASAASGSKSG